MEAELYRDTCYFQGDSVDVFSGVMNSWVPGVVTAVSGGSVKVSYTVEEAVRSTNTAKIRKSAATAAVQAPARAGARAGAASATKAKKAGGASTEPKVDGLPKLPEGDRYWIVQKAGGLGRQGAGQHMCIATGRTGIMLYTMNDGEHFKTYTYEDLRSWEANTNSIRFEKRRKRTGATPQTVEYSTLTGEAMEIVESIMAKVTQLTQEVKDVVKDLGLEEKGVSGPKLTKFFAVKKAAGRGRGKQMRLTCGQMGVQVFNKGEHYKTYYYKDLDEWATLCSTGSPDEREHNRLILSKRSRDGMSTEYSTNPGGASPTLSLAYASTYGRWLHWIPLNSPD